MIQLTPIGFICYLSVILSNPPSIDTCTYANLDHLRSIQLRDAKQERKNAIVIKRYIG